jgi:hypothetical protein
MPPPDAAGSSVGYMVRNHTRRGHLPSCQTIYMTIGILLKRLVSDRGGGAAAADDVNDGGLSYDENDDDVDDKE